jgi:uncharacterized protein
MTTHTAPVAAKDRFESLDVLRGVAVMGILMVNIQAFAMVWPAYQNPTAHMDFTGINQTAWFVQHVFFEMKFITLFSAMFGAGIILMTGDGPDSSTKVHYRRMLWLLAFGLVHAYALWFGDILFTYALAGMIVVLFRRMSVGKLVFWGLFWTALTGLFMVGSMAALIFLPEGMSAEDIGMAMSPDQLAEHVAAYQAGWLESRSYNAFVAIAGQLSTILYAGRIIGVMFLGMALFKSGFLLARWSVARYAVSAAIGLGLGVPLVWFGADHALANNFALDEMWLHTATNYVGSLLMAFGYAAVVMLICKAPVLALVRVPFRAAGRMAFTNYLTQSMAMVFIFVGAPGLGLFGTMERIEQVQLVVAVWAVQLIVSVLWLQVFRYGPFEWLWRALTYGKLHPILKERAAA